jgi:hypothetical protein
MKKSKKFISLLLSVLMIITSVPFMAYAYDTSVKIDRIEISDVELIERTRGQEKRDIIERFEDVPEITPYYFYYNTYTPYSYMTVYIEDGTVVTGGNETEKLLRDYGLNCEVETAAQDYYHQWTVGNSYDAVCKIGSISVPYKYTVIETPIESLEIADRENGEYTNGEYNPDNRTFERYYIAPLAIKVNYKDGTSEVLKDSDFDYRCYGISKSEAAVDPSTWTAGNTYEVTYTVGTVKTTYNITITPRSEDSRKFCYNDLKDYKDGDYDEGIIITGYLGNDTDLVIPETIDGKKVMTFGYAAFHGVDSLKSVVLPSIKDITSSSFSCCHNLESVTIPDTVVEIKYDAFVNCEKLKTIYIPESVDEIGGMSLGYCFGYDEVNDRFLTEKVENFTIMAKSGSAAELYAIEHGFNFVSTGTFISFPDVSPSEWYYAPALFNARKGYITGYGNGYFGPADNIQRQDFVVILSRLSLEDISAYEGQNGGFPDVPTDSYYSAAIAWAKDKGILSGYADGRFGVADPITREQMCVLLFKFLQYSKNYSDDDTPSEIADVLAKYPDGNNVSDWARSSVAWMASERVVGNNGTLNPAGNANRAETTKMIERIIQIMYI